MQFWNHCQFILLLLVVTWHHLQYFEKLQGHNKGSSLCNIIFSQKQHKIHYVSMVKEK